LSHVQIVLNIKILFNTRTNTHSPKNTVVLFLYCSVKYLLLCRSNTHLNFKPSKKISLKNGKIKTKMVDQVKLALGKRLCRHVCAASSSHLSTKSGFCSSFYYHYLFVFSFFSLFGWPQYLSWCIISHSRTQRNSGERHSWGRGSS